MRSCVTVDPYYYPLDDVFGDTENKNRTVAVELGGEIASTPFNITQVHLPQFLDLSRFSTIVL